MNSKQPFVARMAELYQKLRWNVDVDLLVYTPQEFERLRHRGFVRHAVAAGKFLYEKQRP